MTEQLDRLAITCPPWFNVRDFTAQGIIGDARVARWNFAPVALLIEDGKPPRAREETPGHRFPATCFERHIELDGRFCLGLDLDPIYSLKGAEDWWDRLRQFLQCQSLAHISSKWPPHKALDHGREAGELNQKALELARWLVAEDAYLAAKVGAPSWFNTTGQRKLARKRAQDAGPLLRPRKTGRRGKKADRVRLEIVAIEMRRRAALKQFWRECKDRGMKCCGTMKSCGLVR